MYISHYIPPSTTIYRLDYFIEICILGLVFFLPLSLGMATGFLLAGTVAWIAKMVYAKKVLFRRTPFDVFILLLVFISAISVFMSPDKGFSFYNYYNLMGRYILSYYLVINNIRSFDQVKQIVAVLFASTIVVVFYGYYQYFHGVDISTFDWVDGDEFPELKMRVFSTLENPNILAGYLNVVAALVIGLGLYTANTYKRKTAFSLLLLGLFICVGMTFCRGAWISIIAIAFTFAVLYSRKIFLVILLAVPLIFFFGHDALLDRLASILHPYDDSSSALRLALWDSTWEMIKDHPILGIGWGAYWLVYPAYNYFIEDGATMYHAHNMYLNIAAEIGIPGFLIFLALMTGYAKLALSLFRETRNRFAIGLTLGIFAALIGLVVSGFTDYVMFNIQLSMLFWLLNAFVVSIWQLQ